MTATDPSVRRLPTQEITTATDTREYLANALRDTLRYGLDDYLIVDVDSHHVELDSWPEDPSPTSTAPSCATPPSR